MQLPAGTIILETPNKQQYQAWENNRDVLCHFLKVPAQLLSIVYRKDEKAYISVKQILIKTGLITI